MRATLGEELNSNELVAAQFPDGAMKEACRTLEQISQFLKEDVAPEPLNTQSAPPLKILCFALESIQELLHLENEIEIRMADLLLELDNQQAWRTLGYHNVVDYGESCLGMGATTVRRRTVRRSSSGSDMLMT